MRWPMLRTAGVSVSVSRHGWLWGPDSNAVSLSGRGGLVGGRSVGGEGCGGDCRCSSGQHAAPMGLGPWRSHTAAVLHHCDARVGASMEGRGPLLLLLTHLLTHLRP